MFQYLISTVFTFLNWMCPKYTNKTVFCSFPDFDDMLRGMLPYIKGTLVVLIKNKDKQPPDWLPDNVIVVKKNSVKGLFHIFTAKTIYFTHGLYSFFKPINKKRQYVVNLWHGMALKNIGRLDGKKLIPRAHRTICTSPMFQSIHAKAFDMKCSDVLVSGLPRNDVLLMNSENTTLNAIRDLYNKCFVWLPTYRKSLFGDIRNDGDCTSLFCFDNFDYIKLNEILKNKNQFLIVKPHPMAIVTNFEEKLTNIKIINEDWLYNNGLTLYELLSISDGLWTDYSSVFIDYLLLNRPILFIVPDKDNYQGNRGFTFDTAKYPLPGIEVNSQKSLFSAVETGFQSANDNASLFNCTKTFNYKMIKLNN